MVDNFVTQFNYVMPMDDEPIDDTIVVERAGYIPAKKQIEAMMYSGQRLIEWRMDEFGGETNEAAENDYLGIDSCRDYTDLDGVLRKYAEKGTRDIDTDPNHDDGKPGNGEPVSVTEGEPGAV